MVVDTCCKAAAAVLRILACQEGVRARAMRGGGGELRKVNMEIVRNTGDRPPQEQDLGILCIASKVRSNKKHHGA